MIDLPLLHVTLHLQQQDDLRLPEHAGSMLRGAFGHALRKLACVTKQKDCSACPLYRSCPYTQIFETPAPFGTGTHQQTANPYIIQTPPMGVRTIKAGECWSFGFTLIGKAIDQLPLAVYAWQKACERGFGSASAKATLCKLSQNNHTVYTPDSPLTATLTTLPQPELTDQISLHFATPVRLQHEGQIVLVREQLTADVLLGTLIRRVQKLLDFHTHDQPQLDTATLKLAAKQITLSPAKLRRFDVTRYSSRQQQYIELNGLVGDITLSGNLKPFAPLLALGEYVHIGKNATHGLGRFSLAVSSAISSVIKE